MDHGRRADICSDYIRQPMAPQIKAAPPKRNGSSTTETWFETVMSGRSLEPLSKARSLFSEPNVTTGFVTANPLQMAETGPTTARFKRMT